MNIIKLTKPDDWHCHLRDDAYLQTTVPAAAQTFERAIVMPNLKPPVTTVTLAQDYLQRIQRYIPRGSPFQPLMTLYLTPETSPKIIQEAKQCGFIYGCKLYPAGATTHSQAGISDLDHCYPVFEQMEKENVVLQIHGEVTDPTIDVFDREKVFIDRHLSALVKRFPGLQIVLEHITTTEAVSFVTDSGPLIAATITPHHLLLNRNAIFVGGIRPHHYCLPILKRMDHQVALIQAATSGNPKFFLGTDSAPHGLAYKESACGCAGIFNHLGALEMYAQVFESVNQLDKLEGFSSFFGADFYNLARNTSQIELTKQSQSLPLSLPFGETTVMPFLAGETLTWQVKKA